MTAAQFSDQSRRQEYDHLIVWDKQVGESFLNHSRS